MLKSKYIAILISVSVGIWASWFNNSDAHFMMVGVVLIYCSVVIFCLKDIIRNMGLLIFGSTLFAFQVSRSFVYFLKKEPMEQYFSDLLVFDYLRIVFIAYVGLMAGWLLYKNKRNDIRNIDSPSTTNYLFAAKSLYYISLLSNLYYIIVRGINTSSYGYQESYLYAGNIPIVIVKLSDIYIISFMAVLATANTIKKVRMEIISFLTIGLISLVTGQRNGAILPLVFMAWYFSYQAQFEPKISKYLSPKNLLSCIYGFWGLTTISNLVSSLRGKYAVAITTLIDPSLFFLDIGGSNAVLLRTFTIHDKITTTMGIAFLFSPLINLVRNNSLVQAFFGITSPAPFTAAYALTSFNYGAYHTFMCNSALYFNGGGFGSSYLAESYVAFGQIGVFVISMLYSVLLITIRNMAKSQWWWKAMAFNMVYWLFYTPRDTSLYFITAGLNVTNILAILLIYVIGKGLQFRKVTV